MNATTHQLDAVSIATPMLFGSLLNWAMYGGLVVQVYVYAYNFPNDKRLPKLLGDSQSPLFLGECSPEIGTEVYGVFLLETAQMVLKPIRLPIRYPVIGSLISVIVQGFFVYRIWVLSKKLRPLCVLICTISVAQATSATFGGIQAVVRGTFVEGHDLVVEAYIWLVGTVVADALIAGSLILFLMRRSDCISGNTVQRIVRLTIETNALTASIAIVALALVIAFPVRIQVPGVLYQGDGGTNLGFSVPSIETGSQHREYLLDFQQFCIELTTTRFPNRTAVLGKLYSNTLLVSLNNRISIQDAERARRMEEHIHSTFIEFRTPTKKDEEHGASSISVLVHDGASEARTITPFDELPDFEVHSPGSSLRKGPMVKAPALLCLGHAMHATSPPLTLCQDEAQVCEPQRHTASTLK
ncbi:hypothetical protein BC834DRAFT_974232 [Gloeopeniophorella convolvens]|nr:hypothetical protein BC834DRAFT_974232 [Gloeopeniophorella convolvens]